VTRPRPALGLFWAIAAAFLVAALVGALAQSLVAIAVLRPLELREQRVRAQLATARFASEFAALPAPADSARILDLLVRVRSESGLLLPLLYRAPNGFAIADRPERTQVLLEGLESNPTKPRATPAPSGGEPRPRLGVLLARPLTRADRPAGELLVLRALRPTRGPGAINTDALLLSLPIALIAALVAALVMVRLLVRRLRALERLAARVAAGDFSAHIDDSRGDEIGRLAEGLNRMAERLAAARAGLEAQEKQRRQLFADITHELATPLTSIRGYTETLLNPGIAVSAEERTRYLEDMLAESQRLDRMIRDLFDLARIEAGATTLEREPLDWMALCRNVTKRFEPRFSAAGLRLEWGASPAEAWIEADGHRMVQVLENLLTNALRYVGSGGTVTLAMEHAFRSQGGEAHRLVVSDDGAGIPPEDLPLLFERFYRSPGARAGDGNDPGGSGLGLAIVREIVQRHEGEVRAHGASPSGLVIEITIPARG